jgi:peptidyl-prolyl cis-trans isomerase SurA
MGFARSVVPAAMAAALVLGGAPAAAQDNGPMALRGGAAAVVNDDIITNYDLSQRAMLLIMTSGVRPTEENQQQILQQALRGLVDERLQIQELRRMEKLQNFKIVATDEEVNQALTGLARDNNLTLDQFLAQLRAAGLDPATLREQYRAQISWQRMMQGRYGSRVRIGEDQIRQALQRYEASAAQPQYQLAEIFLDAQRVGGMGEALDGARQLIQQIRAGAPFGAVARQFSASATAGNGGDMGWITPADVSPELASRLEQLPVGQVSEPIQTGDGVYILFLRNKRTGGDTTLVSVRQAAAPLTSASTQAEVDAAMNKLRAVAAKRPTCQTLDQAAADQQGVVVATIPETDVNAAPPEFLPAVEALLRGQPAEPVRSSSGAHLLVLCSSRTAKAGAPDRDQVENRLYGEQMAMLSRRYLRDLRNSATIETP